jgi:signal peptidase I
LRSGEGPQPEAMTPTSRRRAGLGCLLELVETLVLTLVIFFVVQNFVAQPFQVKGDSMEHSFEPDDYVLVDKLSPHWDPYSRGDVVVLQPPEGWAAETTPFIKRVIGVGGDTIQVKDGLVYVNGTALDEPYLFADANGASQPTTSDEPQWLVPTNDIFVMGDHRQQSADSRLFGPIPVTSVVGRAVIRYWPLAAFGTVQTPSYASIPAP